MEEVKGGWTYVFWWDHDPNTKYFGETDNIKLRHTGAGNTPSLLNYPGNKYLERVFKKYGPPQNVVKVYHPNATKEDLVAMEVEAIKSWEDSGGKTYNILNSEHHPFNRVSVKLSCGLTFASNSKFLDWVDQEMGVTISKEDLSHYLSGNREIEILSLLGVTKNDGTDPSEVTREAHDGDIIREVLFPTDYAEMMERVMEALPKLSSRKQELIRLRYLTGKPVQWTELVEEFNISKVRLHKLKNEAIEALQNELL